MNKKLLIFFLFAFLAQNSLFAFGPLGHYITGDIAQSQLSKKALKKITPILNNATLPMVSNWADNQKSNPDYKHTSNWHYLNIEADISREQFEAVVYNTDKGQLVHQINVMIDNLQQNRNDTVSLLFLIHLVEDLHCPMHMGRPGDRGGNDIPVFWFGKRTNLHSIWDDALIETQKLSYSEYADHLRRQHSYSEQKFTRDMIVDWAWQTYCNSNYIYQNAALIAKPYNYIYKNRPMLEEALFLGGAHLALILNAIYQ